MSVATSVKKAARKVEKAVTGTEPEADLLDTLKEEHEEVAALLKKLTDDDASASERRKLVTQIKAALVPHVKAEQKVLYDAIIALRDKDAQQDGEEGYIEHALASKTLADLEKISNGNSPEFLIAEGQGAFAIIGGGRPLALGLVQRRQALQDRGNPRMIGR